MRYYFISGEASGDLHAANCMREVMKLDSSAIFGFTGGESMEEVARIKASISIKQMAFMGFVDVLKNLGKIKKNFEIVKADILRFKPNLLILVDYPGFNLRMAKWAHEQGIKIDYYISPTVWAWKENRIEIIRKYINKMFVILPFEEAFYLKHNMKVYFIGHPLIDAIEQKKPLLQSEEHFRQQNNLSQKPIIAVLPGSRLQEVQRMMGLMLEVIDEFKDYQFVIAGSTTIAKEHYARIEGYNVKVVFEQTYELMSYASAGIIKSGTSTLESALFNLPQVVCYKSGALSFAIGKRLVNVKFISLVNLILDKPVVKELIQNDLSPKNIASELRKLLFDANYRNNILNEYRNVVKLLGGGGASARIAKHIVDDANTVPHG